MNNAQLQAFRNIAASMQTEPSDWQWIGPHMSQRMFGITKTRAEAYAERHGGIAVSMVQGNHDEAARYGNMARIASQFYITTGNPAELTASFVYARLAARYAQIICQDSDR